MPSRGRGQTFECACPNWISFNDGVIGRADGCSRQPFDIPHHSPWLRDGQPNDESRAAVRPFAFHLNGSPVQFNQIFGYG